MAPDVLSPQHSEASALQPGMNGRANQARRQPAAQTLATTRARLHATASALPLSPHPLPAKRLDLPDEYRRSAGMDTAPLDRPPATTPTQHPHPTPSGPTPTQQKATTSQSRLNVMSIQVRGLRWPTPLTPRPRSTSVPIGQQRTYWGLPDIRQAVGPGWIGLRTDRQ
jgi:hypothetical protein